MGTIRVSPETRSRPAGLKENPRESFDSVINRLIDFYEDDDPLTREDVEAIREALEDIREGRLFTQEEVKEKLGLNKEKPYTVIYAARVVKDLEELSAGDSERTGGPGLSEPNQDEIRAIEEYEKKKRTNSTPPPSLSYLKVSQHRYLTGI